MTEPDAPATTAPVLLTVRDGVACLRLNRPPLHILDQATNRALAAAIRDLAARPAGEVRVVVLGSEGGRAFSAGLALEDHSRGGVGAVLAAFHDVLRALNELRSPVVAAVRGAAHGPGLELLALCDRVIAEESATFGLPEIKLGYTPVARIVWPMVIGPKPAADLILSGETIDARAAKTIGLVSRVVADGRLERVLPSFVEHCSRHGVAALAIGRGSMGCYWSGPRGPHFLAALAEAEKRRTLGT